MVRTFHETSLFFLVASVEHVTVHFYFNLTDSWQFQACFKINLPKTIWILFGSATILLYFIGVSFECDAQAIWNVGARTDFDFKYLFLWHNEKES